MEPVKGVLIDLGGVVYQGGTVIAGSVEAIRRLRDSGTPFRFLTNTTSESLTEILAKLASLGVEAGREELFTPAMAARLYIVEHDLRPFYLVSSALKEDFRRLPKGARPAVVVGDAREGFTYGSLNQAFRQIQAGAEFIALASNRFFLDENGEPSLDVGAFVAALEYATGKEAIILGKPSAAFFHLAVADMGLQPHDVAMIGDDAEFDVVAAIRAGVAGYLVRTGKWTRESLSGLEIRPTREFDDLLAAVSSIVGRENVKGER